MRDPLDVITKRLIARDIKQVVDDPLERGLIDVPPQNFRDLAEGCRADSWPEDPANHRGCVFVDVFALISPIIADIFTLNKPLLAVVLLVGSYFIGAASDAKVLLVVQPSNVRGFKCSMCSRRDN